MSTVSRLYKWDNKILTYNDYLLGDVSAGSVFSPSDVSGMVAWWGDLVNDGDTRSTLDNDASIWQWDDQSGNGNDWEQATVSRMPVYKTADDTIYFDGSDDGMGLVLAKTASHHVFLVCTPSLNTTASYIVGNRGTGSAGGNRGSFITYYNNGGVQAMAVGTLPIYENFGTYADLGTDMRLWSSEVTPTTLKLRLDGSTGYVAEGSYANFDYTPYGWTVLGCARSDTWEANAQTKIQEFLIYDRVLSDTERGQIQDWINDKYSLW